jgi:hypothetical protein
MHDLLFENQLHLKARRSCAATRERLGLDLARYDGGDGRSGVSAARARASAQRDATAARAARRPFIVNGRIQDVSFGIHTLFEAVEALLKK